MSSFLKFNTKGLVGTHKGHSGYLCLDVCESFIIYDNLHEITAPILFALCHLKTP